MIEMAPLSLPKILLDPVIWQEALERFAAATNLAVLLTDTAGRALGNYINCRPTWSMLRREKLLSIGKCPFCIEPAATGRDCIKDSLETGTTVMTADVSGLVHLTIPLFLFGQPLGALAAGQVFDRYPNHLLLHKVAEKLHVSSDKLWQCARLEFPLKRETLQVYGRLLETFADAFLQARYQTLMDTHRLADMTRLHDSSAQRAHEQGELAAQRQRQIELSARTLEDTRKELNAVNARLVSAHEEEHERMARELHDSLGQSIVALQLDINALQRKIPNEDRERLDAEFKTISHQIRQIADEVRHLSHQLHPWLLSYLGLEKALQQIAQDLRKHHSLAVEFTSRNVPDVIPPAVSLGIYRIVQESVYNIVRHSGSTTANISLIGTETSLEVWILDTGKGFEVSEIKRGLGLINMSHRTELLGGTFDVESHPGQGTKINARLPIRPSSESPQS